MTRSSAVFASVHELEVAALVRAQGLTPSLGGRRGAVLLSHLGEHALCWAALGLLGAVLDRGQRRSWLRATATVVGAHGGSIVVKQVVRRHRPNDLRVQVLVSTPSDWGFPSSHAASTTAAAVAYSGLLGRRWPLLLVPVMMAARMIVGVHYPSDVLAGAVAGSGAGRWASRASRVSRGWAVSGS